MVVQDGGGTVELLGQKDAHHTVRQGEAGQAHHHAGLLFEAVGHAVRAADDEADVFAVLLPAFEVFRQLDGGRCFAAFVKNDEERALRYGFEDAFFFRRHALGGIHARAAFFGFDFFERVGDVASEAFGVFGDGFVNPARHFGADCQNGNVQCFLPYRKMPSEHSDGIGNQSAACHGFCIPAWKPGFSPPQRVSMS